MRRFFVTMTMLIGVSTAAVALPGHASQTAHGGDTGVHGEQAVSFEDWLRETIRSAGNEANALAAAGEDAIDPARDDGEVHFRSPEILSILRRDRAYGDGAGGSLWLIPVNWDARTGSRIPIQAILGDPAGSRAAYEFVAERLRAATARQVRRRDPAAWAEAIDNAIQPDPMYLATFTFVPSTVPDRIGGIAWHFEPDTIAPRAEGIVSITIPQAELREHVAPEWRDMFAGEPRRSRDPRYVSAADVRDAPARD